MTVSECGYIKFSSANPLILLLQDFDSNKASKNNVINYFDALS